MAQQGSSKIAIVAALIGNALFAAAALSALAGPANAAYGDKLIECVDDKTGASRLTNSKCKKGEREVRPQAIPEAQAEKKIAPPGILAGRDGVAVGTLPGLWTVHNVAVPFKWDKKRSAWKRKGKLGKRERAAVEDAVEAFNMTRDLRIRLKLDETDSADFSIDKPWKNRDKFVIYWAKDAKPGQLPKPFRERDGANAGGCSVVVRNPDGSHAYAVDGRIQPGAKIVGAALFMVEFSRRVRARFKCKGRGYRYELLHQIGHCLGLGHKTPAPSVMSGTCGEDYYPNDIENFRYLYR
jgi:hypothetical protein